MALILILSALTGCGVELLATTAIQSTAQAEQLKAMKRQISHASDTTAQVNLQRGVSMYYVEKGKYPATLDELAPNYLPSVPTRPDGSPYGYDPETGKVSDNGALAAPVGPTPGDYQKLDQILAAIDKYGRTTGYYPPTLQALVPTYLTAVPKTDAGQDFYYDVTTGTLLHPLQANPATGKPAGAAPGATGQGGGGAGPMGEAMTGIGIQNQLNSMGQSGANSAGSYSREKLGDTSSDYGKRQEQAMDNLGL